MPPNSTSQGSNASNSSAAGTAGSAANPATVGTGGGHGPGEDCSPGQYCGFPTGMSPSQILCPSSNRCPGEGSPSFPTCLPGTENACACQQEMANGKQARTCECPQSGDCYDALPPPAARRMAAAGGALGPGGECDAGHQQFCGFPQDTLVSQILCPSTNKCPGEGSPSFPDCTPGDENACACEQVLDSSGGQERTCTCPESGDCYDAVATENSSQENATTMTNTTNWNLTSMANITDFNVLASLIPSWCISEGAFDCTAGVNNWEAGWSPDKKEWCCKYFKIACEEIELNESLGDPKFYSEFIGEEQRVHIINLPVAWSMEQVSRFHEAACKEVDTYGRVGCKGVEGGLRAVAVSASPAWVKLVMKRFIKLDPGVTFADADAFAEQNLKLPLVEPAEAQPEGQEDGSGASLSEAPARRLRIEGQRTLQLTQSLTSGTGCSFAPGTQCFERLKSEGLWGLGRVGGCAKGGGSSCDGGHEVRYKMGYGVHVYVLDTGIMTTHDEFRFLNRSGEDGGEVRAIPTFEVSDDGLRECDSKDTSCALDRHGHGTHAAGIIGGNLYGLAKYATLHACKVLDDDGSSSMWRFMVGVNWVAEKGKRPAIIAASVSASGRSASLEREISRAVNGGVVVVVAAGNVGDTSAGNVDSDSCSVFPGNIPFVVTVGATNADDTKASFSRGGSCIDMFAPGQDILSAGISKRNATRMMSSTSMAASHVAGVATLLQWDSDESHLMPEQISGSRRGWWSPRPTGSSSRSERTPRTSWSSMLLWLRRAPWSQRRYRPPRPGPPRRSPRL
ncbi:unnamed protein product [Prorocentrum cordatum]|uniref:subtilisin n=1 Tax=Prorocentrum cordatum TaxID=2364126 RepID=A0ABN9U6B7_9DINO|nr:unnamed protein product [Polarella glacialis]